MSVPTVPNSRPSITIERPFTGLSWVTVDAATRPKTMMEKYSAGPKASATDTMRSEEHTSELQSLMRISYAVFCLKKKNYKKTASQAPFNHNPLHTHIPTKIHTLHTVDIYKPSKHVHK